MQTRSEGTDNDIPKKHKNHSQSVALPRPPDSDTPLRRIGSWGIKLQWLRLWTDTLDDHKIAKLSDYEFRVWIFLLCCASEEDCSDGALTRPVADYQRRTRRVARHFQKALETFQSVGLITMDDGGKITITNWKKRQYKSDNVTARVRKHRESTGAGNVSCNVSETSPETESESYTDSPVSRQYSLYK